jgi:CRISPR-associated protein (TIGR03984 family)
MTIVKCGDVPNDLNLNGFLAEECTELGESVFVLIHTSDSVILSEARSGIPLCGLENIKFSTLNDLRAFNEKGELRIWKWNGKLKWRLRQDECGDEEVNKHDELHFLWGTQVERCSGEGYILHEKGRGCAIHVPWNVPEKKLPLRMRVRNYYEFEDDGLLRFYDARIVTLEYSEGGALHG